MAILAKDKLNSAHRPPLTPPTYTEGFDREHKFVRKNTILNSYRDCNLSPVLSLRQKVCLDSSVDAGVEYTSQNTSETSTDEPAAGHRQI